jgi:hypothetical protein
LEIAQRRCTRYRSFSVTQCLFSLVQRFFAGIQVGFSLSKLLFSRSILFLTGANHRQRNKHREDKEFFHITDLILSLLVDSHEETDRVAASQMKVTSALALSNSRA